MKPAGSDPCGDSTHQARIMLPGVSSAEVAKYCELAAAEFSRLTGLPSHPPIALDSEHFHFRLTAPGQPRSLQVQRAYRKHLLRPLQIDVQIDGGSGHAHVCVADWQHLWQVSRTAFDVAHWAAEIVLPVLQDRKGLLRIVSKQPEFKGPSYNMATDFLVEVEHPETLPSIHGDPLRECAEAILWTWGGAGDRQIVPPRYSA